MLFHHRWLKGSSSISGNIQIHFPLSGANSFLRIAISGIGLGLRSFLVSFIAQMFVPLRFKKLLDENTRNLFQQRI